MEGVIFFCCHLKVLKMSRYVCWKDLTSCLWYQLVNFSKGNTEGMSNTKDPIRISSLNRLSCVNNNTCAHKTGMLPVFMISLSPEITHQQAITEVIKRHLAIGRESP